MKKQVLSAAIVGALGLVSVTTANAAIGTFASGNWLDVTAATYTTGTTPLVSGGSWFGMDTDGNSTIAQFERTGLAMGTQGLVIGSAQNYGGYDSHPGPSVAYYITPPDVGNINAPWDFFGNTGKNFTTVAPTGTYSTTTSMGTAGLNLSGWTVTWAGIPAINMGGNAWGTCGNTSTACVSGMARVVTAGTNGAAYTLDYSATVPLGDPSGFGGVKYKLHLVGFMHTSGAAAAETNWGAAPTAPAEVPVPAAVWLLGSGLLGLVGVARRKKA